VSNNQQGNAELSRSVAALRAALEKEKAENASLNRSYKAVVDDHKRVLAQLQSARKG
jgi:RecA-family ATPase